MAETTPDRRLVFVRASDMELWGCRPLGMVDVLDLRDQRVGVFDGLVLDSEADRPLFLVIRQDAGLSHKWFLVPVGDAWFDETERAIRIDLNVRRGEAPTFNPDEFDRMTPDEAADYERRVLAQCCPEVGLHRDGTPDYTRQPTFECPAWLRPPSPERAGDKR